MESKAKHNLTGIVYEAVPDSCWDNFFDKLETANSIKDFDLMLGESYDVSQSKQPACGIVVTLRSGEFTATQVTDADGKYEFIGLPNGSFSVSCEMAGAPTRTGNERTASAQACILLDCDRGANLRLANNIILKGRIVDTDGKGVSGAGVFGRTGPFPYSDNTDAAKSKDFRAISQSDGSYELFWVEPTNFFSTGRYLFSGHPNGDGFCITIVAGDQQRRKSKEIQVPLITEEILYTGRRMIEAHNKVAQRSGEDVLPVPKEFILPLPESKGNIIMVPDIIIE